MKVLHVITYLSDGGGAEKLLEDLLPTMKDKGLEVSVAVLREIDTANSQKLKDAGINIIPVGTGHRLYSISKMFKLLHIMKQYDIIHTHLTPPFLMGAFNSYFCNAKFVNTIHNTDTKFRHIPFLRSIEKWALSRYDSIIACSKEAENALREFWGKNNDNIETVNNGVKLNKFRDATPSDEINSANKNIIMVAVFRAQKDHETLIKATALLPERFHTYLVGYGGMLEAMKDLSKSIGVGNRVHFLGKRTDVPNLLKASDFVVLSSHYEGLSLSSIEGMSVGKPFIASDVPGLRELVGGYGELFEEGNAKQLTDIIKRLAEDDLAYKAVAAKCLERAESYDMDNMAGGYIKIYKQLFSN